MIIDLEEKKKNSVVIEPEKKHCTIPSVKVMYDEMTEMLVECFPEGIPVSTRGGGGGVEETYTCCIL